MRRTGPIPQLCMHHPIHSSHSHNACTTPDGYPQLSAWVVLDNALTWADALLLRVTQGEKKPSIYFIASARLPAKRTTVRLFFFTASALIYHANHTPGSGEQAMANNNNNIFIIRKTTAADVDKLPAIERSAGEAFRSIPELAWIADDEPQTARRHLELLQTGVSWVAVPGGESLSADGGIGPVGFLNGQLLDNGFLHIWEMSVDRDRQGQGLGKRLLQAAVDYAAQRRYKGLTLTTFLDVPWNDAFYKTRGFALLAPQDISPPLCEILNDEARDGLPRERRCAMRLELP